MNVVPVVLRILIVANWLVGAGIVVLLFMPHERWILDSFNLSPSPDAARLVLGMRAIAVLGLLAVPLNHRLLTRLKAIVETVRDGNAFAGENVSRTQTIGWTLVALQLLSMVIGAIGSGISTPAHPIDIDAGFSAGGWLAVMAAFVAARVFEQGERGNQPA